MNKKKLLINLIMFYKSTYVHRIKNRMLILRSHFNSIIDYSFKLHVNTNFAGIKKFPLCLKEYALHIARICYIIDDSILGNQ